MCVCVYVCVCVYMCVCTCVYTYIHTYIHTYALMYVCVCLCVYIHTYTLKRTIESSVIGLQRMVVAGIFYRVPNYSQGEKIYLQGCVIGLELIVVAFSILCMEVKHIYTR